MLTENDLAKYGHSRKLTVKDIQIWPFLDEGKSYIQNMPELKDIPLTSLLKTSLGENALRYAIYRARCALHDKVEPVGFKRNDERILSYFFLKMLISYSNNPIFFADKVARHIAHTAYVDYLSRLGDSQFQTNIQKSLGFSHDDHIIPVVEYIPLSVTLKEKDSKWKCVNAPIVNGNLHIPLMSDDASRIDKVERNGKKRKPVMGFTDRDLAVLFEERLYHYVKRDIIIDSSNSDIKMIIKDAIIEAFGDYHDSFKTDYGEVVEEKFPPCINYCLSVARAGNNLSHPERFALVTYCHEIGMSDNEIVEIFSSAAHFDLNTTMYQVRHVTGKEGADEYRVPACNTLKTNQICKCGDDPLCATVKHPLGYYLAKIRKDQPQKKIEDEKQTRSHIAMDTLATR